MSLFQQDADRLRNSGSKTGSATRIIDEKTNRNDQNHTMSIDRNQGVRSRVSDVQNSPNPKSARGRITSNRESSQLHGSAVELGQSKYYQSRYYQEVHR